MKIWEKGHMILQLRLSEADIKKIIVHFEYPLSEIKLMCLTLIVINRG